MCQLGVTDSMQQGCHATVMQNVATSSVATLRSCNCWTVVSQFECCNYRVYSRLGCFSLWSSTDLKQIVISLGAFSLTSILVAMVEVVAKTSIRFNTSYLYHIALEPSLHITTER